MKTHWKKAFDSPYIGSWDLDEYKDLTLTIEAVTVEMTHGLKENSVMNVCYFKEKGYKAMLLNSTNSKMIKSLSKSPYLEDWAGTRITLFVQQNVRAFGENHDALRIRPVTTEIQQPVLTPKSGKWELAKTKVKEGMTFEQISKHYIISEANFKLLK